MKSMERKNNAKTKRRDNILYKLRRKGVTVDIKQRTIYIPYGKNPDKTIQVVRLRKEFNFGIQFIIV